MAGKANIAVQRAEQSRKRTMLDGVQMSDTGSCNHGAFKAVSTEQSWFPRQRQPEQPTQKPETRNLQVAKDAGSTRYKDARAADSTSRFDPPRTGFELAYRHALEDKLVDDEAGVDHLKRTVLRPFFDRMQRDHETIVHLHAKVTELEAKAINGPHAGTKRKAESIPSATEDQPRTTTPEEPLTLLANDLFNALDQPVPDETIQLCGLAPLKLIATRPQDVVDLAYDKLHTWPYEHVPVCWRRMYEEAALHRTMGLLHEFAQSRNASHGSRKRIKLENDLEDSPDQWLATIVKQLDGALVIAGAPARKSLIDLTLNRLDDIVKDIPSDRRPRPLQICPPRSLDTEYPIFRATTRIDHEGFQMHMQTRGFPLIVPQAFEHWPARKLWQDVTYLQQRTLNGHRLVPVELGSSYVDESWSQKFMTFREFMEEYLLPDEPPEIGYLAQHDLFAQVPSLKDDISIPDYCWTTPPLRTGAAAKTYGLDSVPQLEEPLINAWLGPKGTKSPLHTDPYHNILCQVVGYKYVRLYAPEESSKLYPDTTDASGISIENTSQIDVHHFRSSIARSNDPDKERELQKKYPLFEQARYVEAILGPGECLYIPLGYWHYVESLTTSFSVSFWWN